MSKSRKLVSDIIIAHATRLCEALLITPWDINNGSCDSFADSIVENLIGVLPPEDNAYVISFGEILSRGPSDEPTGLYPASVAHYGIKIDPDVTPEQLAQCIRSYFDESHRWVVLETEDGIFHFDAEAPGGVTNPLELPTFKKFLSAAKRGVDLSDQSKVSAFCKKWKEMSDRLHEQSKNDTALSFSHQLT